MRMSTHLLRIVLLLGLASSLACTRKVEDLSVHLSLSSSGGIGTLNSGEFSHIAVNVRGPGISPIIVWEWDDHTGMSLPPDTVSIQVPRGAGRIIQFLGVTKNASGVMEFYYGDQLANLDGATKDVYINALPVGGASKEGRFGGRYLTSASDGPTGTLIGEFNPPGAASTLSSTPPPMEVVHSGMFSGWFNVMVLEGAPFTYRFKGASTALFSNLDLSSAILNPSGNPSRVRISVPYSWVEYSGGGGGENMPPTELIMGYFGPGVVTQKACYSPDPVSLANVYEDSSRVVNIEWDPVLAGAGSAYVAQGGTSSLSCTGTDFVDQLMFNEQAIGSHDQVFGFKGPYAFLNEFSMLDSDFTPTGISVSWAYLPGITLAGGISGSKIFYTTAGAPALLNEIRNGDGVACAALPSMGFSAGPDVAVTSSTGNIVLDPADIMTTIVVVCPYRDVAGAREYFNTTLIESECLAGMCSMSSPSTALDLDLTLGSLGPLSITNSGGYYVDASGYLVYEAGSNTGRFTHDPVGLVPLGLLIEEGRTNFVFPSSDMGAWTAAGVSVITDDSGVADLEGATGSDLVDDIDSSNGVSGTEDRVHKVFTGGGAGVHTASVWAHAGTSSVIAVWFEDPAFSCGGIAVDLTTGDFTGIGYCSLLPGTAGVEAYSNGWYRVWVSTNSNGGSLQLSLVPAWAPALNLSAMPPTIPSTTSDRTATGSAYFWGAQVEFGAGATSYILTTGGSASRDPDIVDLDFASSGLSPTEGSIAMEVSTPVLADQYQPFFSMGNSPSEYLIYGFDAAVGKPVALRKDSSSTESSLAPSVFYNPWIPELPHWVGMSFASGAYTLVADDELLLVSSSGALPNYSSGVAIGRNPPDNKFLNGAVGHIRTYSTKLKNYELVFEASPAGGGGP